MIFIIVSYSYYCYLGLIMTQKHAPRLLICNLKSKLTIYKQRVPSSVPLLLTEEAPHLVFQSLLRSLLRSATTVNVTFYFICFLYFVANKLSTYATIVFPPQEQYNLRDTTHIKHLEKKTPPPWWSCLPDPAAWRWQIRLCPCDTLFTMRWLRALSKVFVQLCKSAENKTFFVTN